MVAVLVLMATLCLCLLGATDAATAEITQARELVRDTMLVADGRPPAVLAPTDGAYTAAAGRLRTALTERLGVAPETVTDIEAAAPGTRTIVAIGNMLTNPLITRLYFNGYSYEDSLCPSGDAYVIRVAHDPYPWRGGHNVIILGAENPTGAGGAVGDFLARLQGQGAATLLPYTLVVSGDATPHTRIHEDSYIAGHYGYFHLYEPLRELPTAADGTSARPLRDFIYCADAYVRTGNAEAAQRAIASMAEVVRRYAADPAADHSRDAKPNEFDLWRLWEPFEYCPLMTDTQRLDFLRCLLICTDHMQEHQEGYPRGEGVGPVWNHLTEPLIGAYGGGRYFAHYYGIDRGQRYVDLARECFTWQARSWRSAEDSASYLTMSTDSCMQWSLAEWDLAFFESGMAREHAEFAITICDQVGDCAGFGDGGGSATQVPNNALPCVFWYTRDADLLWALNHYNRAVHKMDWPNPFWRDVEPQSPKGFDGVRAVMMDPLLYERSLKYPYYGGYPLPAPDVPVEQALDKVAFRESWDRDAQYALMDGFGLGYHLHYDTQALIRLSSDGQIWLMDDDYLERDSARHSMLTLLYNGRCNTTVPAFARRDMLGDSADWGMVRASVPNYNHADWSRAVVWRKGKYFLLFDEMQATEAGEFVFDLGFRLASWPEYNQRMVDDRTFLAERDFPPAAPAGGALTRVVEDEGCENGRAVEFLDKTALLAARVPLVAGEWTADLRGLAEDPSHDTVFMEIADVKVDLGMGKGRYGGSACEPFELHADGEYVVKLYPRELTPFRIDRITLRSAAGDTVIIEGEELRPLELDDTVTRFVIQNADGVGMMADNEWVDRLNRNRMYVRQRRAAQMADGETRSFASLLVPTGPNRRGEYELHRLGPRAFAISGKEPGLVVFGAFSAPGIDCDAGCVMVSPTEIAGVGIKSLSVGGVAVAAGDQELDLTANPALREAVGRLLDTSGSLPEQREDEPGGPFVAVGTPLAGEPAEPLWRVALGEGTAQVAALEAADLDGDGTDELVAARGSTIYCVGADGKQRWSFDAQGLVRSVAIGRFRDGKGCQVLMGGSSKKLQIIDAAGVLVAATDYVGDLQNREQRNPQTVTCVAAADLNGDGIDEALAGGTDWKFHIYDAQLKELYESGKEAPSIQQWHNPLRMRALDVDGDGRQELFIANRYGSVNGYRVSKDLTEAEYIFHRYLSIGDVTCAVGDIDGDGQGEVALGVTTGDFAAARVDKNFDQYVCRFDNFGYGVNRVEMADLDGDGKSEVIIASATGYVYVLRADGSAALAHRLGRAVRDLVILPPADGPGTVLAGDATGRMAVVDLGGSEVASWQAPSGIVRVAAVRQRAYTPVVVAATVDGELVAFHR